MSHRTSAEVVLDSVAPYGSATRLTSIYVVFPKMVLGERNRHRAFSLSDRSSRAVPPEKLVAEVRDDPAMPAMFRRRAKGMGGGEELVGDELAAAENRWRTQAYVAAAAANDAAEAGEGKETANRHLDPYVRMHSLMTATRDGWMNFFGLRLDAAADPTIQVLAQRCWEVYSNSTPGLLKPGEWHLPFFDTGDVFGYKGWISAEHCQLRWIGKSWIDLARCLSAARCAHLSYDDLETGKRMTVQRALAIYEKLVGSRPIHASPCEHQATPDERELQSLGYPHSWNEEIWTHPEQHGNLFGWRQYRKMLPGEAVADLPNGYEL